MVEINNKFINLSVHVMENLIEHPFGQDHPIDELVKLFKEWYNEALKGCFPHLSTWNETNEWCKKYFKKEVLDDIYKKSWISEGVDIMEMPKDDN